LEQVLFFHIIFVRDCVRVATHLGPVPLVQGGRGAQSPQFHPLAPVIKFWKVVSTLVYFTNSILHTLYSQVIQAGQVSLDTHLHPARRKLDDY